MAKRAQGRSTGVAEPPSAPPPGPPDDGGHGGERSRRRGHRLRRIGLALLALVLLLYFTRGFLLHPCLALGVERLAPSLLGMRARIGRLSGNWFTSLGVDGLELEAVEDDLPLRRLRAGHAALRSSWIALWRDGLAGLDSIELEDARVEIDTRLASQHPTPRDGSGAGGAELVPDRLPRIEGRDLEAEIVLSDGSRLALRGLGVRASPEASGASRVEAVLERAELLGSLEDRPSLELARLRLSGIWGGEMRADVERLSYGDRPPASLELSLRLEGQDLVLPHLELRQDASRLVASDLVLPWDLGDVEALASSARGRIVFESTSLDSILHAGSGSPPPPAHSLALTATLGDGAARLDEGRFEIAGGSLLLREGRFELRPNSPTLGRLEADIGFAIADLAPLGALLDPDAEQGAWAGSAQGDLRLVGALEALHGRLSLSGEAVNVAGLALGELAVEASSAGGSIAVSRLEAQTPWGALAARGAIEPPAADRPWMIELDRLDLATEGTELRLERPAKLELGGGGVRLDESAWTAGDGRLVLAWQQVGGRASLRVDARAIELQPFLKPHLPADVELGTLDASLELERENGKLTGSSAGSLSDLRMGGIEEGLILEWELRQEESRLAVERVSARTASTLLCSLSGSLPLAPLAERPLTAGRLELAGRVDYPAFHRFRARVAGSELGLDGDLDVTVELGGSWETPSGRVTVAAPALMLVEGERGVPLLPEPASLDLALALGRSVSIERLALDVPQRGTLSGRGDFDVGLGELAEWNTSEILGRALDLSLELEVDDIAWLAPFSPELRRLGGRVEGELGLSGSPADPRYRGRLRLRDGELRLASEMPPVEAIQAELELDGRTLRVVELRAELGAAPFEVTGRVDLGQGSPRLDLSLQGENVLLARSNRLRVRADADLSVVGPLERLRTSGRIGLRNSRLQADVDFLSALQGRRSAPHTQRGVTLFSLREPPLSNMEFDVTIDSVEPVQVESNVASGAVRIDLKLSGTGEVPTPRGRIFIDPTRVKLPSGTFLVPSGTITFQDANPFHPELDLRAEGRRAGHDITLDVSGTLEAPIVEPRASPPLERQKLLVLVLTGQLPPEDFAQSGLAATQAVSLYLAKDLVTRWLAGDDDPGEESFFERIEFVSGSDVSKSGVLTTEASFRMRRGMFGESDALYLVAERDVWEDYNMGLRLVFRFP